MESATACDDSVSTSSAAIDSDTTLATMSDFLERRGVELDADTITKIAIGQMHRTKPTSFGSETLERINGIFMAAMAYLTATGAKDNAVGVSLRRFIPEMLVSLKRAKQAGVADLVDDLPLSVLCDVSDIIYSSSAAQEPPTWSLLTKQIEDAIKTSVDTRVEKQHNHQQHQYKNKYNHYRRQHYNNNHRGYQPRYKRQRSRSSSRSRDD